MLYGTYDATVDKAGRLTVPARLRPGLTEAMVAMPAIPDRNRVLLLPADTGHAFLMDMSAQFRFLGVDTVRQISADTYELDIDKAGRILLPAALRELTGIHGAAKVVGVVTYCEVWDEATFAAWREQARSPASSNRAASLLDGLAAPGARKGGETE